MVPASQVKTGAVLRLERELHKVLDATVHSGAGRAGSSIHLKLRNLANGHVSERRLAPDEKVDELESSRVKMQLLFRDGETFTFMNAETFDQIPISRTVVGPAAPFLKENDECEVEFFEDKPLAVLYPRAVELRVASTPAGLRGHDSTTKEAALDNGLTIQVPQFIEEGDRVRVDVETGKYLERVSEREVKGARFSTAAPPVKAEGGKPAEPAKPDKPKAEKDKK